MKDCIERDPLVAWLQQMDVSESIINVIKDDKSFPPDVKSGTWKRGSHQYGDDQDGFWTEMYLKCSECGYERRDAWIPKHKPPYCEECGAKMEADK